MAKRILLVDDEPLILKGLKFSLEQDGYETDTAADGEEALAKMRNGGYDIVLLDVMLHFRGRRGGQSDDRSDANLVDYRAYAPVFGSEIVTPL